MGYAFIIAAALLWATIGPSARFALQAGVAPLEISFWRAAIGGLLFALHAAARGRLRLARSDLHEGEFWSHAGAEGLENIVGLER